MFFGFPPFRFKFRACLPELASNTMLSPSASAIEQPDGGRL
jgi:hypothetical protein